MAKLNILGGSGEGRSLNVNASRSINLYPDLDADPESKAVISLTKTPGCSMWGAVGAGPNRGQHPFNGLNFVVSGSELRSLDASKVLSPLLGTLLTVTDRVSMKDNGLLASGIGGNQLIIVDGQAGYIYEAVAGTFTQISSPGFPLNPTHVEYIDGYFIVTNDTMAASASELYDGTTWNALATTPVQSAPDNIKNLVSVYQQLLFLKEFTAEFFYDTGTPTTSGFPFSRVSGGVLPYGIAAPWSLCRGIGSVFWLAQVWTNNTGEFIGPVILNGAVVTPIGSPAINYRMSLWTDIVNVFAYCYSEGGHNFVVFTSPGDNQTFVYDAATQMWHERSTYTDNPYQINRHVGNSYAFFNGAHLLGDYQSGNIYQMRSDRVTDHGLPMVCVRRTNHIFDGSELDNLFVTQLQLDVDIKVRPGTATAVAALSGDAVLSCTVTNPGFDYVVDPQIVLVPVDGNGSGATATAIAGGGGVQSITVTAGGSGYTQEPQVVLVDNPIKPTIGLASSTDGGDTWSNERIKVVGKRVVFNRLSKARDKVWQIRFSDPASLVLLGGYGEVDK